MTQVVRRVWIDLGPEPHEHPLVVTPWGVDDDLSDAATDALEGLSMESLNKPVRWLGRWLTHLCQTEQSLDAIFTMPVKEVRLQFRLFLKTYHAATSPAKRYRDGSRLVNRTSGSIADLGVAIATIRAFYEGLRDLGVYEHPNPFAVDGYEAAAPQRAQARAKLQATYPAGDPRRYQIDSGNYFRALVPKWGLPGFQRPAEIGPLMLEAARAKLGPSQLTLLMCMVDDGPRSGDLRICNAYDWSHYDFSRVIHAPSKGSKKSAIEGSEDRRVKWVVITQASVDALAEAFDARHKRDPRHPNMAMLHNLKEAGDHAALKAIPLFPNSSGKPLSHSGFHKPFRRAMLEANLTFEGRIVWPHLARHADISKHVEAIFARTKPGRVRNDLLKQLLKDKGLKSNLLHVYASNALHNEAITRRIGIQDGMAEAYAEATPKAPLWSASPLPDDIAWHLANVPE
jgi:hypothetical protein